jgi:hypothetical protein
MSQLIKSEFYKYGHKIYIVMGRVSMKDPQSRKWIQAYIYTDGSGTTYVRECRDFEAKFKRIEAVQELTRV